MALLVAVSALRAVEFIGMPEAKIPLAQATIYIAKAPKSNADYKAIEAALNDISAEETMEVPDHLKDSHYPGAKKLGHGTGYKYPHNFGGYVEQEYLKKKKKYFKP
jgi:putative ATPase